MINNGFQKVYDQFYSHYTKYSDIALARSYCNSNSILCAGGSLANSDILLLVACGNYFQILTNTTRSIPNLVGSVYWYMTPGYSFGFSPSSKIDQSKADIYNQFDPFRLSWNIDLNGGGWRLGNITYLTTNNFYKKLLFVKV